MYTHYCIAEADQKHRAGGAAEAHPSLIIVIVLINVTTTTTNNNKHTNSKYASSISILPIPKGTGTPAERARRPAEARPCRKRSSRYGFRDSLSTYNM